jgi:hypothetical protein
VVPPNTALTYEIEIVNVNNKHDESQDKDEAPDELDQMFNMTLPDQEGGDEESGED